MDYLDDDDDDPVVAEYEVYITGDMPEEQLYMLQYLNRAPDQPLTQANHNRPSEVRIKQDAGFIEVDVPMDIHQNYNRPAGVRWGESLRKTKGFGQQAYGIASGFERTMPRATNRSGGPDGTPAAAAPTAIDDDDNLDEYVNNFEDANEKGHVLNTQTYGGQIIKDDGKGPSYMVGTFRDNELHLTRLDGIVQLRTQFHHIDASAQLEAVSRRREKESQEGSKPAEPKAFLPTVKKTGGDTPAELNQAFMKAANQEPWLKLNYTDENEQAAFDAYNDRLFLHDTAPTPKLRANVTNSEYLDSISGRSGNKPKKRAANDVVEISEDDDGDAASADESVS